MTSLLGFASHSSAPKPKTHISHGSLPPFIDPRQPPTKRSPWRQIHETPFIQSLTITLAASLYDIIFPNLASPTPPSTTPETSDQTSLFQPRYHKLIQPLSILLSPSFLTTVKTNNLLLLSEGNPGTAPFIYHLLDGTLHIEMARDVYERAGIQGQPLPRNGGARKHGRDRHTVALDLRAPSMLHGKKGFERLAHAAEGALGDGVMWLLRDVGDTGSSSSGSFSEVISQHNPTTIDITPETRTLVDVHVPEIITTAPSPSPSADTTTTTAVPRLSAYEDDYHDLIEWLDLLRLHTTQVSTTSTITDPYISRYQPPEPAARSSPREIKTITWTGLLDREWCARLLVEVIRRSRRQDGDENGDGAEAKWLAFSARAHRTHALGQVDGYTVLLNSLSTEEGEEGGGGEAMEVDDGAEGVHAAGFQRFTCFQFVDGVVVS